MSWRNTSPHSAQLRVQHGAVLFPRGAVDAEGVADVVEANAICSVQIAGFLGSLERRARLVELTV
jgi:hypothetical protein